MIAMRTIVFLISFLLSINSIAQRLTPTKGPVNINYLEYYGLSSRLIQTAVFPLFQDQVKFDGEIIVLSPSFKDSAKFNLNYNPFYEYGLDVMIAPKDSIDYKKYSKRKIKKIISKNLDNFRRNEGRIFINSELFELVSDSNDNIVLKYVFKTSNLPLQYWNLRKYELFTYIKNGVLDKVEIKSKPSNKNKNKKNFFIKTAHYQKLTEEKGYVLKDYKEKNVKVKKGKEETSEFNTYLYNFRDDNGKSLVPERENTTIDSLNRKDKQTSRIRLERKMPVLGRGALKAGYDIPLPFGVELFVHWQKEFMQVRSLVLNDEDLTSLISPDQSNVETVVTLTAAKFDTWIFPFLNISAMVGNTIVNNNVTLSLSQEMKDAINFLDPDSSINQVRVGGTVNAPFVGLGVTLAWGYKSLFVTVHSMFIWSRVIEANTTTRALALTPLIGYKNRIINIMAGVQYQLYDQNVKGNLDIGGEDLKFNVGLRAKRTNFVIGLQKDFSRRWNATFLIGFDPRQQFVLNVGYRF